MRRRSFLGVMFGAAVAQAIPLPPVSPSYVIGRSMWCGHISVGGTAVSAHLQIAEWHLWVDDRGMLRMRDGAPRHAMDGFEVGSSPSTGS